LRMLMVSLCAVIFSLLVYQGGKGRPGGNSVVAVYFISSLDSELARHRAPRPWQDQDQVRKLQVVAVYFISSLDSGFSRGRRREREKRRGRVEVWGGGTGIRFMHVYSVLRMECIDRHFCWIYSNCPVIQGMDRLFALV
jgi:hypothetical protein